MSQRAFLALAIVAGLTAAVLYYAGAQRTAVVVAAEHLLPGRPIVLDDVETRWMPADAVPEAALTSPSQAVGLFPRGPIWPGQLLLATVLGESSAAFESGLRPPTGYRAIAVPVAAHQALGGAIAPGARVDVIAVGEPGPDGPAPAELLSEGALVIDVRGEHGGAITAGPVSSGIAPRERIGSVVLAVGAAEGLLIAERIPRSTFVLVLVPPAQ